MASTGQWEAWDAAGVRRNALRAVAVPVRERSFVYREYERSLLEPLSDDRFEVVPLRELPADAGDRVTVGLRHDVDDRLESALELGRREHRRGLRATYFVLHTAAYYRHGPELLGALRTLQDELGHEIGWHNDLVTLQCVRGVDAVDYLHRELEWLRTHGIDVTGTAAHGARACYELGYSNVYFFADFPEVFPELPNRDAVTVDGRRVAVPSAHLADFGLDYEATRLPRDHYFSDAAFDARGRRWHPRELPWPELREGQTAIVLTHPCLWDASPAAKAARTAVRLGSRALRPAREPA